MDFQYTFEPDNGLCVYRPTGLMSVEGMLEGYAVARRDPGWSESYDFLHILDDLLAGDMSPEVVTEMAERMIARNVPAPAHSRLSAVVCNDPLKQAILLFWTHSAAARQLADERVFLLEAPAREWLRLARSEATQAERRKM